MKYRYQGRTKEGELQVGFVEAGGRDGAVRILAGHDVFVLSLEQVDRPTVIDSLGSFFGRVRMKHLAVFTRQFATLLEARLPLNVALKTLHEQTSHAMLKNTIRQISEDVNAGLALSQALERQSSVFPAFFISMVRSAEVVGNLDEVSGFLADYIEKEQALISKSRSAMIYPAIVIVLFLAVVVIMLTYVFPQIGPVFEQSGVELPAFSQFLISSGKFLASRWPIVLTLFVAMLAIAADYLRSPEGKALMDELKVRMPIVRRAYLPLTMTRFSNVVAMLLKGGVPITQTIQIAGQTVGNTIYQELLQEVAGQVREGKPISEAMAAHPRYFPQLVPQMLVVGEASGQIDKMFLRLAQFYAREADMVIGNLVDLIQPILMVGIGILVGVLFGSILLPLYQLTASIH
ncbi:MAG: type II secretion system F family protein [Candidatus Liptonbacteria bacterium]|nr:type II secretion system F family protein [Candidatus Liptonbacteria bacterium]